MVSFTSETTLNSSSLSSIQRLNRLIKQHYTEKSSKFYQVFPILLPYIHYNDIPTCALLNSSYNLLVKDTLWNNPRFDKIAYIHDALYIFNNFLKHLPYIQTSTASRIHQLDLQHLQESLYDRVNPKFLQIVTQYCTHLSTLNLEKAEFFNAKSLPKGTWALPHLTHLNLSYCPHVNDEMIVVIARACRQLTQVALDGLTKHKGQGLAGLAAECDQLSSISVKFNTAMEDQAIIALAKFRHIRLLELDLTGCTKLTSTGFSMLARYAAHLTTLSITQTNCKLDDIRKFSCIHHFTESLDISRLKQVNHERLAVWIWESNYQKLSTLTMDATTATALVKLSQQPHHLLDTSIREVTNLKLMDLPEHTPMSYLYQLTSLFSRLTHITFVRAYFETDFLRGMYRTPSPEEESSITDAQLDVFNKSQLQITATVVREREDNVDCNLLNW
ncbi:uncharacterized protein ATC70_010798 [Mucor velutinosus]|uniref:RNI-like protein n=1 Tax=Mucor velutinosus TaxID=708070 RepID=A0AAN7HTC6_9FUNG|nr:hypothetical protein ATC70_010798 [Mucor velutinosus]